MPAFPACDRDLTIGMVNISLFKNFVPLGSLLPSDRAELAKHARVGVYQPGQIIFSRGETAASVPYLVSGEVELFDGGHALFEEGPAAFWNLSYETRGASLGAGKLGGELSQLLRRQLRHLANAVACLGQFAQQVQPLNVLLRVETSVRAGPLRLHRFVPLFPDPNDMRAQPGQASDQLNGILRIRHNFYVNYTKRSIAQGKTH